MRFVWCDHWYDDAFRAATESGCRTLDAYQAFCHGTSDGWDLALRAAGHESTTVIDNLTPNAIEETLRQEPDVICVQNVGRWCGDKWRMAGWKGPLIAFCSYAANYADLHGFDAVCTSFQWFVGECKARGIRADFLPLAFNRAVLERVLHPQPSAACGLRPVGLRLEFGTNLTYVRDIPVSFVGGLGDRIWKRGTADIAALADAVPSFRWWGYKVGPLPPSLERTYQGPAWGHRYYEILMRSMLTVNRHGEIARATVPQNMREWEAGGVGTVIVSDVGLTGCGRVSYSDADSLIAMCNVFLERPELIAHQGQVIQREVLANHCYEHRVPDFLRIVESVL